MKNHLIPLLLLFVSSGNLFAQVTPTCPSPPPPGAEDCFSTCIYCELNGYTGITNGTPSGGNFVCGAIALHNDLWFGFEAGSSSIDFTINTSNCTDGNGLQVAVFDNCSDPDAITCNPGSAGGAGAPLILSYNGYTIGETYFLMIDGWAGDVCDFEILVSAGSVGNSGLPVGNAAVPEGPTTVCIGSPTVYSIPAVDNAGFYTWTAPPGASINGQGATLQVDAISGTNVTITLGGIGGTICVQADNACAAPGAQACLDVAVTGIPPTVLPTALYCYQDLPVVWPYPPFTTLGSPGTYNLTSLPFPTSSGCDSFVKQEIVIKPSVDVDLGTLYFCQGNCAIVGGAEYCVPGSYTATLINSDGCDSTVYFSVNVFNTANVADIIAPQGKTITCLQPVLFLESANNLPHVVHNWTNANGDFISNGSYATVYEAGVYTHTMTAVSGTPTCISAATILIKQNTMPPPVTATGGVVNAQNPTVKLMGNSVMSGVTYAWTGPNGFTSNLKNPVVSAPGFYTLTVTNSQTGCSSSITVEVTTLD